MTFRIYGKKKNVPNHQPDIIDASSCLYELLHSDKKKTILYKHVESATNKHEVSPVVTLCNITFIQQIWNSPSNIIY
jgi:dsRNA-specific ribonuclease